MNNDLIIFGGVISCGLLIGWYLWMATCHTDKLLALAKAEEERRKARHERMGKVAGGLGKAVLFGIKRWKK